MTPLDRSEVGAVGAALREIDKSLVVIMGCLLVIAMGTCNQTRAIYDIRDALVADSTTTTEAP